MTLRGNAAIAIWHNVSPDARSDYFEWHNLEHMEERVRIPGFLRGRRYSALEGSPEFCTLYEAESLDVLTGSDYLLRLENPSPMTRKLVARLNGNVRSLCRVALSLGKGTGGHLMTWRYDLSPGSEELHLATVRERLEMLASHSPVVGAHLCIGDLAASSVQTEEKRARPAPALTPGWVIAIESGGELGALRSVCETHLPDSLMVETGAINMNKGIYQLQFQTARDEYSQDGA